MVPFCRFRHQLAEILLYASRRIKISPILEFIPGTKQNYNEGERFLCFRLERVQLPEAKVI